jgi:hypothetical protein
MVRTADDLREEEQVDGLVDRTGAVSVRVHVLVRLCLRTDHANTKVGRANLPARKTTVLVLVLRKATGSRGYGVPE